MSPRAAAMVRPSGLKLKAVTLKRPLGAGSSRLVRVSQSPGACPGRRKRVNGRPG